MRTQVVILSGHSLFAEGVASRLKNHLDRLDLQVIDLNEDDIVSKVISWTPATIILEAMDTETSKAVLLSKLLTSIPEVTVIRLDPQHSQVQVVTSEERKLGEVKDLIEFIQENTGTL